MTVNMHEVYAILAAHPGSRLRHVTTFEIDAGDGELYRKGDWILSAADGEVLSIGDNFEDLQRPRAAES
jgi:hypothetical protein